MELSAPGLLLPAPFFTLGWTCWPVSCINSKIHFLAGLSNFVAHPCQVSGAEFLPRSILLFFFFFGEGYYSGSHIFVLTDKRFDKWWHWVESWFICRCWRPWAWVGEGNICFRIRICPGMSPPHPFSVPSPSVPAQTQVGTTVHIFVISLTSQLCSEKSPQIFHIISTFCRKRLTEMYNTRMCLQE